MLEEVFQDVYTKFKLHFYQNVFQRFATREATLTTVESFCMEGIMAMGEPTIAEFSRMMGISTPNAAYKNRQPCQKRAMWRRSSPPPTAANTPAPHPEIHRLLQHQLFLPAHGHRACAQALPGGGLRQDGADALGHQHRADAGAGYAGQVPPPRSSQIGRIKCSTTKAPGSAGGFLIIL